MTKHIGTCSICGGSVTLPTSYMSTVPPVPKCQSCGATAKPTGPVIEMTPRRFGGDLPIRPIKVPR